MTLFARALLAVVVALTLTTLTSVTAGAATGENSAHTQSVKKKPHRHKVAKHHKHRRHKAKHHRPRHHKPRRPRPIAAEPVPVPTVFPTPWLTERTMGVATFNVNVSLDNARAMTDISRLTNDPDVDVIGLQEARRRPSIYTRIPGWTAYAPPGGGLEDVVMWRTASIGFVSAQVVAMCPKVRAQPARWANVVTLGDLATGRRFTIVDTHSDTGVERDGASIAGSPYVPVGLQQWQNLRALVNSLSGSVIGMGDFNIDWNADQLVRDPNLWSANLDDVLEMNWSRFGTEGYKATQGIADAVSRPSATAVPRYIDGVFLKRSAVGPIDFESQRVVTDMYSDHNAVLARVRVSG